MLLIEQATSKGCKLQVRYPVGTISSIKNLAYANYILLLADLFENMKSNLNHLKTQTVLVELKINARKTKVMWIRISIFTMFIIGDHKIEEADKFCYLSSIIFKG